MRVTGLAAVFAAVVSSLALASVASASYGSSVTINQVSVGSPNNASVAIVPFSDAIYQSCATAPAGKNCVTLGGVGYNYGIGQLEITVGQWVAFLNTADPLGKDPRNLYDDVESSTKWPKFGQINKSKRARRGHFYRVAFPQWTDKPYGFADFPRAARFVNSLYNGRLRAKTASTIGGVPSTNYRVQLSSNTERGMYTLSGSGVRPSGATRSKSTGFVIPSQDEWTKAAYFDPKGGGTYSFWKYPTNAGVFGDNTATAPSATTLNPTTGDVTNAATQPVATYHQTDVTAPNWCPAGVQPQSDCNSLNPFGLDPTAYQKAYQGSVGTVGQAKTRSPWGTLDQGGNVVEWTDTITPSPEGKTDGRVWRRLHGGIANAGAYQLWLSAVGLNPEVNRFFKTTYPWLGFRVGVVGNLQVRH